MEHLGALVRDAFTQKKVQMLSTIAPLKKLDKQDILLIEATWS